MGRPVHSLSLGSFRRAKVSSGSFGFGFIRARTGGRQVNSGSLSIFGRALGVIGFIVVSWIHSGAPCGSSGSFAFVRFLRGRPGGR